MAGGGSTGPAHVAPSFWVLRWPCRAPLDQGSLDVLPLWGRMVSPTPFSPLLCHAVASHPRTPLIGPQLPVLSLCELGHQFTITGSWIQEPPHSLLCSHPASPRGCRIPCPKPLLSLGAGRLLPHIRSPSPALSLGAELWSRMISCNWPATRLPDLFYRHAG